MAEMSEGRKCGECGREVRTWRACARRCRATRAYCASHGGETRAQAEIIEHHAAHDRPLELRLPGPQNKEGGFLRGYWVMSDGTVHREESDAELRERIKGALR